MTLEILISTLDEGINNVPAMLLTQQKNIGYLVSWQHSKGKDIALPHELMRSDVKVCNLDGRGLSRNRNNSIKNATADLCLIADDDCTYTHEQLQQVVDTFEKNPDVDIATFRFSGEGSNKWYPSTPQNLKTFPKGYYVSSIEIAFRSLSVQGKLWFNENFGLGAEPFHCGEENIFLRSALAQGLSCKFFPITVVKEKDSSICIKRDNDPGTLRSYGAELHLFQPRTKYLRMILKAYRLWHNRNVPFFHALRHMNNGINYIKTHPEIMGN